MLKEFKEFAIRGNVIDLAIGIIIGGAFGKIVDSLVKDIIMPPVGMVMGKVDFASLFINLSDDTRYATLAEARKAGAATLNYGTFISTIVDFTIMAFVVFLMVKQINRLKQEAPPAPQVPDTRDCPFCRSTIPLLATRCPQCTSQLS